MKFFSACSGLESASVAWRPLGWKAVGFSEIEKFPCRLLKYYHPAIPNYGDLTKQEKFPVGPGSFDLLVGGTPCQGFSIAGGRGGLTDDRSSLAFHFLELARRVRPRWLVWENVPGVRSSNGGRDFGAILRRLEQCGYGWAYRTMDAQFFGVPQHRPRLFLVGYLGDWRRAAASLFEAESLRGNPAESFGEAAHYAPRPADGLPSGSDGGSETYTAYSPAVARCLNAGGQGRLDLDTETFIASQRIAATLTASAGRRGGIQHADSGQGVIVTRDAAGLGVRKLTVIECERLQGFPDEYTRIPVREGKGKLPGLYSRKPWRFRILPGGRWQLFASETCRYKALGNSKAVPVIRWLGERIAAVDGI